MDSLLLVAIVIGVIMILAGLARMNRKNQQNNEYIDHSVLFDKEAEQGNNTEANMGAELETLGSIIADEKKTEHKKNIDTEAKKPQAHMFSLFDKFSTEKNKPSTSETKTRIEVYKKDAPDWVIVLSIVAPEGSCFVGSGLVEVIKKAGFSHGDMGLFHYQDKGLTAFSLASLVKPGTFDLDQLDNFTTPGISLFIQYPNQYGGGVASFNNFLSTTQNLAKQLGGEVRDEKRSVLTYSAIEHIREKITAYDLKWRQHHS